MLLFDNKKSVFNFMYILTRETYVHLIIETFKEARSIVMNRVYMYS